MQKDYRNPGLMDNAADENESAVKFNVRQTKNEMDPNMNGKATYVVLFDKDNNRIRYNKI